MPINMPIFANASQDKFNKINADVDQLIAVHQKTIGLLMQLKHALYKESFKNMPENQRVMIEFDRQDYLNLKRAFTKAQNEGKTLDDVIVFKGHDLLLGYAKYLIEYLATKFE